MSGHRRLEVPREITHLLQWPFLQSRHLILEELAISSQNGLNRRLFHYWVEMTHSRHTKLRILFILHNPIMPRITSVFCGLEIDLIHLVHIWCRFSLRRHPKHRLSLFLDEILRMRQLLADVFEHGTNQVLLCSARVVCVVHFVEYRKNQIKIEL